MSNPVQKTFGQHTGTSSFATFGAAVSPGNAVFVVLGSSTGSPSDVFSGVTDDKGNSYTILQNVYDAPSNVLIAVAASFNITNGPTTVTATKSGASESITVAIYEVSGVSAVDVAVTGNQAFGAGAMSATFSTASVNEFAVIGVASSNTGTFTQNNGWSQDAAGETFFNAFSSNLPAAGTNSCSATPSTGTFTRWVILTGLPAGVQVVNVGTKQSTNFNGTNAFSWTLSPTPAAGNTVVIPWSYLVVATNAVPTPSCSDNQGNSYTFYAGSKNTSAGSATSGGTVSGVFVAQNVVSSGAFTVTVTSVTGNRASLQTNHLELLGNVQVDQTGISNSGNTEVASTAVTASGANTSANDLVVAVLASSTTDAGGASGSDPPLSGYTSIYHGFMSSGVSNTLGGYGDAGYRSTSGIETSSATWSAFPSAGYTAASVVTFTLASPSVTVAVSGQRGSFSLGALVASGGNAQPVLAQGLRLAPGPGISPDYLTMFRTQPRSTTFAPASLSLSITGQPAAFSSGAVGVSVGGNLTLAITGQQLSSAAGVVVVFSGGNVTVSLAGQGATFAGGAIFASAGGGSVAQPQTTRTFNYTLWDTRHVIDRAYGALRIRPQQITPEMIQIALDLLALTLQDLVNDSAPLWTLEKLLVSLNQGQISYTLPVGTNDVDKAFYRTLFNITPSVTSSTPSSYLFDFGVNNATAVTSVSVNWASASSPILIQSSADGVSWVNVGKSGLTEPPGGLVWYDVGTTQAQRFWQIVPALPGALSVSSASLYNTPNEVEMYRMNKDDYWNFTNKNVEGRPLQYWLDRKLLPEMKIWQSPNSMAAQNLMVVYRKRYLMDVGSMQQTIEVPTRWYLPIIFALAEALSWTTPEADPTVCEMIRPKAAQMMRRVWLEERDRSAFKMNFGLAAYTR